MSTVAAKLSFFALFICSACLINAQFRAEIMLLPETQFSELLTSENQSTIVFKEETLKANGSLKVEANSPEELLSFLQHETGLGLVKTFFSLSKFPELKESFQEVSYDARKQKLISEQPEQVSGIE